MFSGCTELHGCTWFISFSPGCHFMGIYETHCCTFQCWRSISLLWKNIISAIFHHSGGILLVWEESSYNIIKSLHWLTLSLFTHLQKVKHIDLLPLDMRAVMQGLSSLVVPAQKVQFSPRMYASFANIHPHSSPYKIMLGSLCQNWILIWMFRLILFIDQAGTFRRSCFSNGILSCTTCSHCPSFTCEWNI